MKTGQSLTVIAQELERQLKTKKDYVAPSRLLMMDSRGSDLRIGGKGSFGITELGHQQIAGRLAIPQQYYQRMRAEAPELLAANVNAWFQKDDQPRMIRTLDGKARALLSKSYRPLDNADMAEAVLPIIQEYGCRVESAELTETRLYIKAVTEKKTLEVKKGDIVQAGIVVSNSEVGCGSVKVEPMVWRLACSNGMIVNDAGLRKYHIGRHGELGDRAQEFLRDETRVADDKAFWMKAQDIVRGALDSDVFAQTVERLRGATTEKIECGVEEVCLRSAKRFGLGEVERAGILTHLAAGGDLSKYGLVQAVTRFSQDVESYDRATELERLGGEILELAGSEWKVLTKKGV